MTTESQKVSENIDESQSAPFVAENTSAKKRWKPTKTFILEDFLVNSSPDNAGRTNVYETQKRLNQFEAVSSKEVKRNSNNGKASSVNHRKISASMRIEDLLLELLRRVSEFQSRAWKTNPIKARGRRRFVCGFGEVKKHLKLGNAKLVIVAEDIELNAKNGSVADLLEEINELCLLYSVTIMTACKKHAIGKALNKFPFVSIVAITDDGNIQDLYEMALRSYNRRKNDVIVSEHIDQLSLYA